MKSYQKVSPYPPKLTHTLSDLPRAALEGHTLLMTLPLLRRAAKGDGHPVLIVPGFGGGDGSTAMLRRWLTNQNFTGKTWNCGRNWADKRLLNIADAVAFRQEMLDKLHNRIEQVYAEHRCKLSLVGWSLGGLYVDQLAQQFPALIRQAITLGTPHGDPRGTAAWSIMQGLYRSNAVDPNLEEGIKAWQNRDIAKPRTVPTTIIYSASDGLVEPSQARLPESSGANHIQINASHCGLTINPRIYWLLANRLAQTEGQEQPLTQVQKPWWL
jgi:pimeloyl-ACP methyl ester carboxylesterase